MDGDRTETLWLRLGGLSGLVLFLKGLECAHRLVAASAVAAIVPDRRHPLEEGIIPDIDRKKLESCQCERIGLVRKRGISRLRVRGSDLLVEGRETIIVVKALVDVSCEIFLENFDRLARLSEIFVETRYLEDMVDHDRTGLYDETRACRCRW